MGLIDWLRKPIKNETDIPTKDEKAILHLSHDEKSSHVESKSINAQEFSSFIQAIDKWNAIRNGIRCAKKRNDWALVVNHVDEGLSLAKERPDLCIVMGLLEKEAGLAYERNHDFAQALARYSSAILLLEKEKIRLNDVERVVKNKIEKLNVKLQNKG